MKRLLDVELRDGFWRLAEAFMQLQGEGVVGKEDAVLPEWGDKQ